MKKLVSLFLFLTLIIGINVPALAAEPESIDELLAPYQTAIKKVNTELGSSFFIPDNTKQQVYNNIKDKTPDQIAALLKYEYKTYTIDGAVNTNATPVASGNYVRQQVMATKQSNGVERPDSEREDITQTYPIQYNSFMYLDSEIFSGSGASGTFTYTSIIDYGSEWASDYTGYHFGISSGSYSLSSDSKDCTVNLTGYPVDDNGIALTIKLSASHTFSAN